MIPRGATHKLKLKFRGNLNSSEFVIASHEKLSSKEFYGNKWHYIPDCLINLSMYDEIVYRLSGDGVDFDSEDACFNAIEMKRACNSAICHT